MLEYGNKKATDRSLCAAMCVERSEIEIREAKIWVRRVLGRNEGVRHHRTCHESRIADRSSVRFDQQKSFS